MRYLGAYIYFLDMKRVIYIYIVAAVSLLVCSCTTSSSVHGTMGYSKSYVLRDKSVQYAPHSACATYAEYIHGRVAELNKEYAKTWSVPYSGVSIDSALAMSDEEAFLDFEAAYTRLYRLGEEIAEHQQGCYLGEGIFNYRYAAVVARNVVIRYSYDVEFAYNSTHDLGVVGRYTSESGGLVTTGLGTFTLPLQGGLMQECHANLASLWSRLGLGAASTTTLTLYGPTLEPALDDVLNYVDLSLDAESKMLTVNFAIDDLAAEDFRNMTGTWYIVVKGAVERGNACIEVPFVLAAEKAQDDTTEDANNSNI